MNRKLNTKLMINNFHAPAFHFNKQTNLGHALHNY